MRYYASIDVMVQTIKRFFLFIGLFSTVTLYEVLPGGGGEASNEYESEAREATHAFPEWATMFIDRAITYVSCLFRG